MKSRRPDLSLSSDTGPVLSILLGCLALAVFFTTLGLGFANLTGVPERPSAAPLKIPAPRPPAPVAAESSKALAMLELDQKEKKEFESKLARAEQQSRQLEEEKHRLDLDRQGIEKSKTTLNEMQSQLQDLARQAAERTKNVTQPDIQRERSLAGANARLVEARRLIEDADRGAQELRRQIQEKKATFDPQLSAAAGGGNPQWVECVRGVVILVPQGERIPVERLKNAPSFAKAVSGRYVVFLVRPSGLDAFATARAAAEESGASRLGYEPIDQNWQIKYR